MNRVKSFTASHARLNTALFLPHMHVLRAAAYSMLSMTMAQSTAVASCALLPITLTGPYGDMKNCCR